MAALDLIDKFNHTVQLFSVDHDKLMMTTCKYQGGWDGDSLTTGSRETWDTCKQWQLHCCQIFFSLKNQIDKKLIDKKIIRKWENETKYKKKKKREMEKTTFVIFHFPVRSRFIPLTQL